MSPSGSSVSSWTNYGLMGGAVSQGTASLQPAKTTNDTWGTGFTGTSMSFVSRDNMNGDFSSTATTFTAKTFFGVVKVVGRSIKDTIFSLRNSSVDSNATTVFNYDIYADASTQNSQCNPGTSTFSSTTGSFIFAASGDTSSYRAQLNSTLGSSGTTVLTATSVSYVTIGYDPGSGNSNDVRVFEFIAYNRKLSTTEYDNVLNYLRTKYNA
jgi:hypothetical protein